MTIAQNDSLQLARNSDLEKVSGIISPLLPKDVSAKISLKKNCLRVVLESADTTDQASLVEIIRQAVTDYNLELIQQVTVYGWEQGEDCPSWQENFELKSLNLNSGEESEISFPASTDQQQPPNKSGSFWNSMLGAVSGAASAVGGAAVGTANAVGGAAVGAASAVGGAAVGAASAVGGAAVGTASAVGGAAVGAASAVGGAAVGAASAVGGAAVGAASAVGGAAVGAASAASSTVMQAPDGVGFLLDIITSSPQLQELTKALKVDWLLELVSRVDVVQAETHVKNLQRRYPNEKPSDIAHRIMLEKAVYVAGSGFASSLMPGFAAAMFAVDLAATMALQAEMIYQIAAAYGLNLQEPARKGEVLAIFGIALGGNSALKAGLGFARNIPIAGAAIGASANAAMLYSLGYAACQFYEAKQSSGLPNTVEVPVSQSASEQYLQEAIKQQIIMDQILVHLVQAGNPGKKLQQLVPELNALQLSPTSLHIISQVQTLPPLQQLIGQLNQDFAISLLAQSQHIAQSDGVITPQEAQIIAEIQKSLTYS